MNENELLREREKLRQVIQKIEDEKKIIEKSLSSSKNTYEKDDFVRAQLIYMGNKKLKDIKQIKSKPYFARIDFKADSDKEKACGTCGTCIDRLNAFHLNGVKDPIGYEDEIVNEVK